MFRSHVLVCGGTGCTSSGSQAIIASLESEIKKNGLEEEVKVVKTGCFGLCALGPIIDVYKRQVFHCMHASTPETVLPNAERTSH